MKTTFFIVLGIAICSLFIGLACASDDHYERYRENEYHEREREGTKLYGIVEKMPGQGYTGTWIINGHAVIVSGKTRIKEEHGRIGIGRYVKVEGMRSANGMIAYEIETEASREYRHADYRNISEFYGTIEALPGTGLNGIWLVSGRNVLVTLNTRIKEEHGRITVGSSVEVKGGYSGTNFVAYEIETKNNRR